MKQTTPPSHASDPATSLDAADAHAASGRHERNLDLVLGLLRAHPGCSGHRLATWDFAESMGVLDVYEIRRRLSDLKELGLAHHMSQDGHPTFEARGAQRSQKGVLWWASDEC